MIVGFRYQLRLKTKIVYTEGGGLYEQSTRKRACGS